MFNNSIVTKSSAIYKFLIELKITLYLTTPQTHHLILFINSMVTKGYCGKITDVSDFMPVRHRTNIGKFLSESPWDEDFVEKALKKRVIMRIWDTSKTTGSPIYIVIDDTISEKTVPSSKAKKPTEKCGFHHSHLKGKTVYGHQLVTVMLLCDTLVLPYTMAIYDKENMSKIQMAIEFIKSLPQPVNEGYVLCDSWYSNKKLFAVSKDSGYAYIGGLRTNRVIYPKGRGKLGIKLNHMCEILTKDDVDLVKVGNNEYYVYTYRGKLNDAKDSLIALCWPKEALFKSGCLRAFISLDTTITTEELLNHYKHRWPIETFFRETKKHLGLNHYQVRSNRSINRYFLLLMMTYIYCELEVSNGTLNFSVGIKIARNQSKKERVSWIFNQADLGISLEAIFKILKIA
ncbi:IS701 family transposase [Clostridium tagluense]|uniref:IS701 family transposase n=1 Tax=Clostridium tagluense TaxID=360422 RepID=UPI00227B8E57|nr:IS701 family transposase [Clostridium tagluense]WAG48720.1 IS701 family transposase [Clostridium tagluense]